MSLKVKNIFIKNGSVNPDITREGKLLFMHITTIHSGTKSLRYNGPLTWNNFCQSMNNNNFLMQVSLNLKHFWNIYYWKIISNIYILLIIFYTYDTYILLESIYQIHNLLFYSGNFFSLSLSLSLSLCLDQSPHGKILNLSGGHL